MSTNFWIHLIIFMTVFIVTGVILSYRAKRKKNKGINFDYEEIRAEVLEAEDIMRQAKRERAIAREELKKAEELKRRAANEWIKIRAKMRPSKEEIISPYEVLGVHEKDSLENIQKHYQKLLQKYDLERNEDGDFLSKRQKKDIVTNINHAYNWIKVYHKIN